MRFLVIIMTMCWLFSTTGCAASEAAAEEHAADPSKAVVKPFGAPLNNGSAIAARIIGKSKNQDKDKSKN